MKTKIKVYLEALVRVEDFLGLRLGFETDERNSVRLSLGLLRCRRDLDVRCSLEEGLQLSGSDVSDDSANAEKGGVYRALGRLLLDQGHMGLALRAAIVDGESLGLGELGVRLVGVGLGSEDDPAEVALVAATTNADNQTVKGLDLILLQAK